LDADGSVRSALPGGRAIDRNVVRRGRDRLVGDLEPVDGRDGRRIVDRSEFPEHGELQVAVPLALPDSRAPAAHRDAPRDDQIDRLRPLWTDLLSEPGGAADRRRAIGIPDSVRI